MLSHGGSVIPNFFAHDRANTSKGEVLNTLPFFERSSDAMLGAIKFLAIYQMSKCMFVDCSVWKNLLNG